MLSINDLKPSTYILYKNQPFEILTAAHKKMGRGGAVVTVKIKNLISGSVLTENFKDHHKFEEPNLSESTSLFLYNQDGNLFFMNETTYEQFSLPASQIGDQVKFLVDNTSVNILYFEDKPINIKLPTKINLKVTSSPPGIKGNTAEGGTKEIVLETGLKTSAPLFINEGDTVTVDTRTGKYVGRA